MKKHEVTQALVTLREARQAWEKARLDFQADYDLAVGRLLREAAANRMSVNEVSTTLQTPIRGLRSMMRSIGLEPRQGKTALSRKAAEALAENAALLGVDPRKMDLTSPLAYLPMGNDLRRTLESQTLGRDIDFDEVSGNDEAGL